MILSVSSRARMVDMQAPARGVSRFANWLAALMWVVGLVAALVGKGPGRILLASCGVLKILGIIGTYSLMIP
jgi:hypothetical protein